MDEATQDIAVSLGCIQAKNSSAQIYNAVLMNSVWKF